MKTSLLLRRVPMQSVRIGLHTIERYLADCSPNPPGQSAFLWGILDPSHSVRFMLANPTVCSMNHELSGGLVFDNPPGSLDSLALGRKRFRALAFLLNHPPYIR